MPAITLDEFLVLDGLPSLPGQILNVLEEISRASAMDYNILQKIQYDPAIALRVLRVANTPLYGYPSRISSLQQAAGLLGPGAIKNIVLTTPILERYQDNGWGNNFDYSRLWLHVMVTAVLAGTLASLLGNMESDVCFTGGLIHGTGIIALAVTHPRSVLEWINTSQGEQASLLDVERDVLGFSHADVGVKMVESWKFPPQLVRVLKNCYCTEKDELTDKRAGVVRLARYLADQWQYSANLGMESFGDMREVFSLLKISDKDLLKWTPQLRENVDLALQAQDV